MKQYTINNSKGTYKFTLKDLNEHFNLGFENVENASQVEINLRTNSSELAKKILAMSSGNDEDFDYTDLEIGKISESLFKDKANFDANGIFSAPIEGQSYTLDYVISQINDLLRKNFEKPIVIIGNLAVTDVVNGNIQGQGTHWVTMVVTPSRNGLNITYADPEGDKLNFEIENYLRNGLKNDGFKVANFKSTTTKFQGNNNNNCGPLAIELAQHIIGGSIDQLTPNQIDIKQVREEHRNILAEIDIKDFEKFCEKQNIKPTKIDEKTAPSKSEFRLSPLDGFLKEDLKKIVLNPEEFKNVVKNAKNSQDIKEFFKDKGLDNSRLDSLGKIFRPDRLKLFQDNLDRYVDWMCEDLMKSRDLLKAQEQRQQSKSQVEVQPVENDLNISFIQQIKNAISGFFNYLVAFLTGTTKSPSVNQAYEDTIESNKNSSKEIRENPNHAQSVIKRRLDSSSKEQDSRGR